MKSNKSYLVKAIYDWCKDSEYTPHLLVDTTFSGVRVPNLSLGGRRMVLNISSQATKDLELSHQSIEFHANFDQRIEKVVVPIDAIWAIYAYENGEGITFEDDFEDDEGEGGVATDSFARSDNDAVMVNRKVHSLKVIK